MDRSSSRCGHYISESRARSSLFSLHLLALQENHTHKSTPKHRWVGWSHPDPHGVQLKTFLRVMKRLRSGAISQVEMNVFHTLMYKTNHVVKAEEWQDILSRAYVLSICFYSPSYLSLTLQLRTVTSGSIGRRCLSHLRVLQIRMNKSRKNSERILAKL